MLMIRLQRVGRKNDPSFRVVLTDSKNSTKSGKFLEVLGSYNARFGKPTLNGDRIKYWMSVGAKVSDTVHNMLVTFKIIDGKKVDLLPPKKEVVEEKKEETPVVETQIEEAPETPSEEVVTETKEEATV